MQAYSLLLSLDTYLYMFWKNRDIVPLEKAAAKDGCFCYTVLTVTDVADTAVEIIGKWHSADAIFCTIKSWLKSMKNILLQCSHDMSCHTCFSVG